MFLSAERKPARARWTRAAVANFCTPVAKGTLSRPGPEDFEKFPRDRVPEAWDEFSEILSPARSSCAVSMKLCECVLRHWRKIVSKFRVLTFGIRAGRAFLAIFRSGLGR